MARIQDIDIPYLEFAEAAAPGTPASGIVRIYAKTDGSLYQKDDAGTETGLAGGGSSSGTFVGVRVRKTGTQSIGSGALTALTFDAEDYDSDAFHDTGSNTSRLTVPSGKGGKYHIGAVVEWGSNPGTDVVLELFVNNTTTIGWVRDAPNKADASMTISTDYALAVGDYVEFRVYQGSGGNVSTGTPRGNATPAFWMHLIGA